jgi:Zn-finger nucleic acid-binding protein
MLLPARHDLDRQSGRPCPRCRESPRELVAHLLGDTLLDECGACGGVWLDAAAFDRLVKSRDAQAVLAGAGGPHLTLEAYSNAAPDSLTPRYLPCPDCGQLMNRKNFASTSGVIIDVCKPHGIWFDRDELGRIVQFVMKGGLETSRRRELERLEQKLKNRREELASWGAWSGPAISEEPWLPELLDVLKGFFF